MSFGNNLTVMDDGDFTRVRTSAQGPEYGLGETRETINGKKYRYVQFKDAVTYAAGQCVTWADATSLTTVTNDISGGSSVGTIPAGVCLAVVAQNGYGWIQTRGLYTTVKTTGADDIVAGENVFASGDGTVDGSAATAVTTTALGIAVAADVDANNTVAVYITVG